MKRYEYNGAVYWFEPEKAPKGAVLIEEPKAANKKAPAKKTKKAE